MSKNKDHTDTDTGTGSGPEPGTRQTEERRVWCQRNQRLKELSEHEGCPYCFGKKAEIEDGWHPDFCDYDPEKDPLHFGFRSDSSRNQHG